MKNPIKMQKGKKLPVFWQRGCGVRKFELDRMENSGNLPNWPRRLRLHLAHDSNPPFYRTLLAWRWKTDRNYWSCGCVPRFLQRIRGV